MTLFVHNSSKTLILTLALRTIFFLLSTGKSTSKYHKTRVSMFVRIKVSSSCNFRLSRYPFGYYTCNTSLIGLSNLALVHWQQVNKKLNYTGEVDLLDFHLHNVTLKNSDNNESLILTMHLTALSDYYLLASFSPSGLMFLICYSTLHFSFDDFNERVMVSLTSMLVLVALFSQNSSVVKTPYYKLLDVWYVVLITLCFIVVISNSVIQILRRCRGARTADKYKDKDYENDNEGDDTSRKHTIAKHAIWCNRICSCFLLTVFLVLIVVYVLVRLEYF